MTEWKRVFQHARTGKQSTALREVYLQCSEKERRLSADFYKQYLAGRGTGPLTPFCGIRQGAGPLAHGESLVRNQRAKNPIPQDAPEVELGARLRQALGEALPNREVAVAVSGGVDSWLLAALLKELGYQVRGWYLETGIPRYCEREQVERSSEVLGIECCHIRANAEDFVAAAAEFIAVTQTPVYNLHPVSKWLFAKGLKAQGITTVVTGDAADQVMRWDWDCDLLPLTLNCFQGAGVRIVAPFMAEGVIALGRQPYPNKEPVRNLAQRLGVPAVAKQPTLLPALTLPPRPRASIPAEEAGKDHALEQSNACLSYTTALLQHWLEETAPSTG